MLRPCAADIDWHVSVDLIVYVVPTHPVGVGVLPDVLGGVPFVIHCVVVAGGVTANPVLLHCFVKDVNVVAISEFERSGICNCVCIRFRKQSSHVAVAAADFVCFWSTGLTPITSRSTALQNLVPLSKHTVL